MHCISHPPVIGQLPQGFGKAQAVPLLNEGDYVRPHRTTSKTLEAPCFQIHPEAARVVVVMEWAQATVPPATPTGRGHGGQFGAVEVGRRNAALHVLK